MYPRRMLPSIHLLAAFDAVARHLSFSTAAVELKLTQSAVSRQVIALEDTMGCALFVRSRRSVLLTEVGKRYHREVAGILSSLYRATLDVTANPRGGILEVAILPTFGTRWLAPRLSGFFSDYPGITINLSTKLDPFDLNLEGIDAAIHFGRPEWPGAELEYLMGEQVLPVCSPAMRLELALTVPSDLLRAPLIHLASRPGAWLNWFAAMGVDAGHVDGLVIDQFATAAQALSGGFGVALMPVFLMRAELDRGELVPAVDVEAIAGTEAYYLAWPRRLVAHPPLIAFRAWLTEQAANYRNSAPNSSH